MEEKKSIHLREGRDPTFRCGRVVRPHLPYSNNIAQVTCAVCRQTAERAGKAPERCHDQQGQEERRG